MNIAISIKHKPNLDDLLIFLSVTLNERVGDLYDERNDFNYYVTINEAAILEFPIEINISESLKLDRKLKKEKLLKQLKILKAVCKKYNCSAIADFPEKQQNLLYYKLYMCDEDSNFYEVDENFLTNEDDSKNPNYLPEELYNIFKKSNENVIINQIDEWFYSNIN